MYISETHIRVRYGETDQMGYVYYGNYASYFEVATCIKKNLALDQIYSNFQLNYLKGAFKIVADFRVANLSKSPAKWDNPAKGWQPFATILIHPISNK